MIASGRASRTSSGVISGSGLAMAKMIGFLAMPYHFLGHGTLRGEADEHVGAFHGFVQRAFLVFTACADFHWFMPSVRPS